jgi:hypothetical protein
MKVMEGGRKDLNWKFDRLSWGEKRVMMVD